MEEGLTAAAKRKYISIVDRKGSNKDGYQFGKTTGHHIDSR
jgi:hypothetical protein